VPKKTRKPIDQNLIDQWPEILDDIDLSAIPVGYLHSVVITFYDGDSWEIVLRKEDRENETDWFSETMSEMFRNYREKIQHVDFRLDVEKLRKDITKSTKKFLRGKK
jgi:hypothetical protein